jgi:hypothetical protein
LLVSPGGGEKHGATFLQLEDFWYYAGLEISIGARVSDHE